MRACGTAHFIAELGEQLAWLGSALRSSHFDKGVAYCRPRLRLTTNPESPGISRALKCDLTVSYDISFLVEQKDTVLSGQGICWYDLFRNPVVVEGFPIPRRPKLGTGLQIPLHIMAGLIRARQATDFDGKLFIKGFSSLLFPTSLVGNTMTWHLIFNDDGGHISYLDPRVKYSQDKEARQLSLVHLTSACIHVLGWCSKANSYAGIITPSETSGQSDIDFLQALRKLIIQSIVPAAAKPTRVGFLIDSTSLPANMSTLVPHFHWAIEISPSA